MTHSKFLNGIFYTIFASITLGLFFYVDKHVPEAYMDEYFHFHQAANYCYGNYQHVKSFSFLEGQSSLRLFFFLVGFEYNHAAGFILHHTCARNAAE